MDLNTYAIEKIAEARLVDLRAVTAQMVLIESAGGSRRGVAAVLGAAIARIRYWRIGHWRIGRSLARGRAVAAPDARVRAAR